MAGPEQEVEPRGNERMAQTMEQARILARTAVMSFLGDEMARTAISMANNPDPANQMPNWEGLHSIMLSAIDLAHSNYNPEESASPERIAADFLDIAAYEVNAIASGNAEGLEGEMDEHFLPQLNPGNRQTYAGAASCFQMLIEQNQDNVQRAYEEINISLLRFFDQNIEDPQSRQGREIITIIDRVIELAMTTQRIQGDLFLDHRQARTAIIDEARNQLRGIRSREIRRPTGMPPLVRSGSYFNAQRMLDMFAGEQHAIDPEIFGTYRSAHAMMLPTIANTIHTYVEEQHRDDVGRLAITLIDRATQEVTQEAAENVSIADARNEILTRARQMLETISAIENPSAEEQADIPRDMEVIRRTRRVFEHIELQNRDLSRVIPTRTARRA